VPPEIAEPETPTPHLSVVRREDGLTVARAAAVDAALAAYAGRDPQRLAEYVDTQARKLARDPQQLTAHDYNKVAAHLHERVAGERSAEAIAR
jgi:hypothetical protein